MAVDFFESPAFSPSWSHEENSLAAEVTYNGDLINWDYWAGLSNISPEQAAKLCWAIDPIKWSANSYALGDVHNELSEKIQRLEQWLKSRFSSLSLSDLIDAVGKDKAPTGMIEAVESKSIDEAKKHSSDIQPLEQLTKEERSNYNSRAAWTWVDAIYILQGYKPIFQLSTEQVRSHFPDLVNYFTQSIQLGNIGKEITQASEKSFIDSPANWQAFWQTIHKRPEPETEGVDGSKGKFEHAETTEWKTKAREIGEKWMTEQRHTGKDPGVIGIAKYVEGELSNQNITGKRGRFLDWETIKREALTGITGKPANGKDQKRRKKSGESPATKIIPQHKTQ